MSIQTVEDIKDRFLDEQRNIEDYLRFLEFKISDLNSELSNIEQLIVKYGFFESNIRNYLSHSVNTILDKTEYRFKEMYVLKPKIEERQLKIHEKLKQIHYPEKLDSIDIRSELGELIFGIKERFQEEGSDHTFVRLKEKYMIQLQSQMHNMRLDYYYIDSIKDVESAVEYVFNSAEYLVLDNEYNDLMFILGKLKQIEIMIKMLNKEEQLSIVRQGFILIMTVFDATIFDLIRISLHKNFFKLIGFFGKNEKIPIDGLKEFEDFESFKECLIEDQLHKKYVKDILSILKKLNVVISEDKSNDDYSKLIELINRRNIHIHNRGIVDDKYLEKNNKDQHVFNIYGFSLGDYAKIDNQYWKETNRLCRSCVMGIYTWITEQNCLLDTAT